MLPNCEYKFHSCKDQRYAYLKIILEMYAGKVIVADRRFFDVLQWRPKSGGWIRLSWSNPCGSAVKYTQVSVSGKFMEDFGILFCVQEWQLCMDNRQQHVKGFVVSGLHA